MASVLETFYFIFESDASKLNQGLQDANKQTEKLEDNLRNTDKVALTAGDSLKKMAGAALTALGGVAAFSALWSGVNQVASELDALGDAAEAIDVPVDELNAWGMAATFTAGSQEALINSVNTLNQKVSELALKGKGELLPVFQKLGLSLADIRKNADDPLALLTAMSDGMSKLSKAEAAGLGAKLGLDRGTINLLSEGKDGLEALLQKQRDAGVATAEQVEKAAEFNDTLDEWRFTFNSVKRDILTVLLPPLSSFFKMLGAGVQWMRDNKEITIAFFSALAAVLIGVYAPAAITAAAATWALIGPYALAAAGVLLFAAAVALLAEDLYFFGQGHDSITGRLAERWPIVGDAIRAIGQVLAWLAAFMGAQIGFIIDLITVGPKEAMDNLNKAFSSLVTDILSRFPKMENAAGYFARGIKNDFEMIGNAWDWLVDKLDAGLKIWEKLNSFSFFGGSNPLFGSPTMGGATSNPNVDRGAIARGQQILSSTQTPLASQTSASISTRNSSKSVTIGEVNVNTQATNAGQIASDIKPALDRELASAIDSFDDGIYA